MIYALLIFMTTCFSIYHFVCACKFKYEQRQYQTSEQGFSILVSCYNEEKMISNTIQGLLDLDYQNYEVWFINDGSVDGTFDCLEKELKLIKILIEDEQFLECYRSLRFPFFYVINKPNTGKALSLNVGLQHATKPLIITMDADCILERNALKVINNTFIDQDVIASGGVVHTMQLFKFKDGINRIVRLQGLDFVKGFYIYKASLAYNNALTIISGAFGSFRKEVLLAIGGFRSGLGEDIDITIRLQEYAYKWGRKITYTPMAICYTECPESLNQLIRQRVRWQKGFIDAVWKNYRFLLKQVYCHPACFFLIIDALLSNTIAVSIFCVNLILIPLGIIEGMSTWALAYFLLAICFQILSNFTGISRAKKYVDKKSIDELYKVIWWDVFLYRFITIYYFIKGIILYPFDSTSWDKLERTDNEYCLQLVDEKGCEVASE